MKGWLSPSELRPQAVVGRLVWILVAVLALAVPAHGVVSAPEIRIEPTTLYFGATPPAASAKAVETAPPVSSRPVISKTLREKAASKGARVIVRLAAPFSPEGALAGAQALAQRQAIGQIQDAALAKLVGQKVTVHARYEHIPFLSLEVDAAALDLLSRLPEVTGIQEDVFQKPFLASSNAVIGSGVAWAKGLTGAGQVIAVLDSGVDKTHPFFTSGGHNKVVSEACYSSNISWAATLTTGRASAPAG